MRPAVAIVLLLLTACGGGESTETAPAVAPETAASPEAIPLPTGLDPDTERRVKEVLQRAGSLFQQARFDEALEAAASAIELAPSHEPTYEVLSGWYVQLDRNDLAIAAFERFASADPGGLRFMARHQVLSGDRATALATLDGCIEAHPAYGGCRAERAALRLPAGNFDGALEDLRVAFDAGADSETAVRLAEALRVTGAYEESRRIVEAGLADDAGSVDLRVALAILQMRDRQDEDAEATLRGVVESNPRSARALRLLAGLVLRRGNESEGRFLLSRADLYRDYRFAQRSLLAQVAATRDARAVIMIAELELTVGDYPQAQQWIERARAAGAPANRVAAAQAWVHYALGDIARGDAELARLAGSDDGRAALVRALRAIRAGDRTAAADWLRQAGERGPAERSFLRRVADLWFALGDEARSSELLARAATAGFP